LRRSCGTTGAGDRGRLIALAIYLFPRARGLDAFEWEDVPALAAFFEQPPAPKSAAMRTTTPFRVFISTSG
jgi:hypothetical protein